MKKTAISLLVTASLLVGGAAIAQSYQFKQNVPGMKPSAGVLSNKNKGNGNSPETPPDALPATLVFDSSVSPNFGNVPRGEYPIREFTLIARNGPVSVDSMRISGGFYNTDVFVIVADGCSGTVLAKDESCAVQVQLDSKKNAPGTLDASLAAIGTTAPNTAPRTITGLQLTTKTTFGSPLFLAESVNFGSTEIGEAGAAEVIQFNNRGDGILNVTGFDVPAGFVATALSCSTESGADTTLPVALRPASSGDSCALTVQFTPTEGKPYDAQLGVQGETYVPDTIQLTGEGVNPPPPPTVYATWNETPIVRPGRTTRFSLSADRTVMTNVDATIDEVAIQANVAKSSGKYFFEITRTGHMTDRAYLAAGIVVDGSTSFGVPSTGFLSIQNFMFSDYFSGSGIPGFAVTRAVTQGALPRNGRISVAVDLDNGKMDIYSPNCSLLGSAAFTPGGAYRPVSVWNYQQMPGAAISGNFGQKPFDCPVPAGYTPGWF